jgi:hypothetical protein
MYASRGHRGSRPDLSFLGIGSSSHAEVPERRETKQERDARKLEKERVARVKERERSLKEEHVDGGYLVTMGVYTGPEDFNKSVVRQLMVRMGSGLACTYTLTHSRLSGGLHLSGEGSMISRRSGQNINWLPLAEVFPSQQLMRSLQKNSRDPFLPIPAMPQIKICRT